MTSACEDHTDPLGEALGRSGHELGKLSQSWCDDLSGETAQRAERGSGEDPGQEAVGERDQDPAPAGDDEQHGHCHDAGGDRACRYVVDRVRE